MSFINDMIVGMEREEGHDEIVEEVVKMLAENNIIERTVTIVEGLVILQETIRIGKL